MKRIWALLACMVFLSLSFFAGAAKSDLVIGHTTEVGSGDKSPSNPYKIQGLTKGLPFGLSLYGNGVIGDEYDPRTGVVTRNWYLMVLDQSQGWSIGEAGGGEVTFWYQSGPNGFSYPPDPSGGIICTHLPTLNSDTLWSSDRIGISINVNGRVQLRVPASIATTVPQLLSWFSAQSSLGTPVTVLYKLSTPLLTLSYGLGDASGYKRTSNVDFQDLGVQNTLYSGDTYVPFTVDGYNNYSHVMQVNTTHRSFELLMDPRMMLYDFLPGNKYRARMDFFVPAGVNIKNVTYELSSGSTVIVKGTAEKIKLSDGTTHYLIIAEFVPERTVEWNNYTIRYEADTTGSYYIYLNRYAYVDSISTDELSTDAIIDEDFGYTKPTNPNMDDGLAAGGDLLDQMIGTLDEFNASLGDNTQQLVTNVSRIKPMIDGVFNIIPLPISICISGVVVFLVIRKVVGR